MKYFLSIIILTIGSLLFTDDIISQPDKIRFERITRTSGLSHSTVYAVVQDNYGFIWIGTADGLNRFDGYNLKNYFHEPENPNSIGNSRIYDLLIDSEGELWIATLGGGLNRYRYQTDDFEVFLHNPDNPNSISHDIVMSVYEDKQGFIWAGTAENGLNRYDKKSKNFQRYLHDPNNSNSLNFKTVISIDSDNEGKLWLALNEGGLDVFDPSTGNFTHFVYDANNPNSISSDRVNHVLVDSHGMVWAATDYGLNMINPRTGKIRRIYASPADPDALRSNEIYYVFEDREKNIWIGTYSGLALLTEKNRESLRFRNFYNNPVDIYSLSNDLIRCIYQDRTGNIWVGNFSSGVDMFSYSGNKFISYRNEPGNPNSLNHNTVRCFAEDPEGNIWIGTYSGGLNRFNPGTSEFKVIKGFIRDEKISNPVFINALCFDSKNNLWIGTWGEGLYSYNIYTGKTRHYHVTDQNTKGLRNNYIRSMIIDKNDILWIATSGGGLNKFDPETGQFTAYINDKNNPSSISENRIMGLFADNSGNIWIGSSNTGLNRFDVNENRFYRFQNNTQDPKSLSNNRVFCIHGNQSNNILWIGTGNGLNKLNLSDSSFTSYSKKEGLPSNVVLGILEDSTGKLWISTTDGLCRFDPETGKGIKKYDENDGLQSDEFSEGAYFMDKHGSMYFGGNNGFSLFNPEKVKDNPEKPPVYIVDFQILNQSVPIGKQSALKNNIILANEIHLDYKDYVFSFEFAALNYNNPGKNQYKYKMEGFDEDWVSTGAKRRIATYTNLDPGEYTFMVMATNNDGVWSDKTVRLKIIIHPPFWDTLVFKALIVGLIVISLFLFYRYRVRKLNRQKEALEQAVKEKTTEIIAQKEELQTINLELSSSNKELNKQRKDLEEALEILKKTQAQLIQSEKMASLGILAAGIAHEINNPLNFIQGGVFRLENYFTDHFSDKSEEINDILGGIQTGISRAEAIVASLNHYSRQDEKPRIKCDVHRIMDNCLNILQNEIKYRIEIVKNYTDKTFVLIFNEGNLHQALLNILTNSIQAIPGKGKIIISSEVQLQILVITIEDNGIGINTENLSRIFDPFFTTKEPGKGTGLGLAITYNIIREHGGTIEFSSQEGQGSTAILKLPLKSAF